AELAGRRGGERVPLRAPGMLQRGDLIPERALLAAVLDHVDEERRRSLGQEVLAQPELQPPGGVARDGSRPLRAPADRPEASLREDCRVTLDDAIARAALGEDDACRDQ